eukprot:376154_1
MADQNKFDTDQVKAISKPSMDTMRRLTYALYVDLEHGPDADINIMETDAKVSESISPEQCKQLVFDTKAVAGHGGRHCEAAHEAGKHAAAPRHFRRGCERRVPRGAYVRSRISR